MTINVDFQRHGIQARYLDCESAPDAFEDTVRVLHVDIGLSSGASVTGILPALGVNQPHTGETPMLLWAPFLATSGRENAA
jgi:hypothetical protein